MTNREKVIKGLECCMSEKGCHSPCPYNGECEEGGYYYSKAIEDAIALLKEQQPRVMTLSELSDMRGRGKAVYYEDRDAAAKCQDMFFVSVVNGYAYFKGEVYVLPKKVDDYNRTWRCLTSCPTDAQREATPWDVGTVTG